LANGPQARPAFGGCFRIQQGEREVAVHHAPLARNRRLCHVQRAAQVHGDVARARGQVDHAARRLVEPAVRPHAHERLLVVHQTLELVGLESDPGRVALAPGVDVCAVAANGQRPRLTIDFDRHRSQVEPPGACSHRVAARIERRREA